MYNIIIQLFWTYIIYYFDQKQGQKNLAVIAIIASHYCIRYYCQNSQWYYGNVKVWMPGDKMLNITIC